MVIAEGVESHFPAVAVPAEGSEEEEAVVSVRYCDRTCWSGSEHRAVRMEEIWEEREGTRV